MLRPGPVTTGNGSPVVAATARGPLWWALLVIPLWAVLALGTHWEPVMRDGWGHLDWYRANTIGLRKLYEFCREAYAAENPRLGQLFTLVSYVRGPYHMIVTPIIELAVFALATVHALGRWPSVRRPDDARCALLVTGALLVCVPQIGAILFYRPFTGNYVWGLALNLSWLVPYRLELAAPRPARHGLVPAMLVLGVAAGLCNEHTGLAFLGLGALATAWAARRGGLRLWMVAGLIGLAVGYWWLLTAPGQHVRYAGLADQAGIVQRIIERGVGGNLRLFGALALALVPALPLLVIALIERRAAGAPARPAATWAPLAALALAGLACTGTLLASPKLGPRLYLASVTLIVAGLVGWLALELHRAWARRLCTALAAGAFAFVALRLVIIQHAIGPLGELRRDRIEHGAPGSVVTVPRYPYGTSRYFLGDDLLVDSLRRAIAGGYHLKALELEPAPR